MNELSVQVTQELGKIDFNYEEIKANLAEKMSLYKDAVFTEDSKQIAKGEVAALRKIRAAIDDKRKSVKSECLKPYQDFEAKAKELMGLIESPIQLIDSQIKDLEAKEKEKKRIAICVYYEDVIGDMRAYLPIEKIFNAKWLNAGTSMKSIKAEITQIVSDAKESIESIKAMDSEAVPGAIDIYSQTLSISKAIGYINDYERQRAEILARELKKQKAEEERRAREQEQRIRDEERKRIAEEERIRQEERERVEKAVYQKLAEPAPIIEEPFEQEDINTDLSFVQPSTIKATYTVVATPEELEEIETIFNSIGIYFSREDA